MTPIRRALPALIAALTPLALCASPARATNPPPGGQWIKGAIIGFDARKGEFDVTRELPAGAVTLVVRGVNTFREKYTLTLGTVDFHNASVPDALKGLTLTKQPTFGGAAAVKEQAAPELKAPYDAVLALIDPLRAEYGRVNITLSGIVGDVRAGDTNFDIRKGVVARIHAGLPDADVLMRQRIFALVQNPFSHNDVEDFPTDFRDRRGDINAVANAIDTDSLVTLKAARAALTTAVNDWSFAYSAYKEMEKDPKLLAQAKRANDLDITPQVNEIVSAVEQLLKERPTVRDLYLMFLNPNIVPTRITKRMDPVQADQIRPKVQIDQALSPLLLAQDKDASDTEKAVATADAAFSGRTYTASVSVYGRWVLDYSVGPIWTTLAQKNFYISPNKENPSLKGVREGVRDKGNVGIGALAQFYMTTKLPLGLTAGPSFGVVATDPIRYLVGISAVAHVGNRVRVSYSYGWAYGKQTQLNGDILDGDTQNPPVAPLKDSPSTASVTRWGHFQGVTLSLSF